MSTNIDARTESAIAGMTDPNSLRQMMRNAKAKGRTDIYKLAFLRLCEVQGTSGSNPIAMRIEQAIAAVEEVRGTRAARTRQALDRKGAVALIKDWLTYKAPTDGYEKLVEAGLWELLGEAIALDFRDQFTEDDLQVARYRIEEAKQGRVADPFLPQLWPLDL